MASKLAEKIALAVGRTPLRWAPAVDRILAEHAYDEPLEVAYLRGWKDGRQNKNPEPAERVSGILSRFDSEGD